MSSLPVRFKPSEVICITKDPALTQEISGSLAGAAVAVREYGSIPAAMADLERCTACDAVLLDMEGFGITEARSLFRQAAALALAGDDAQGEAAMAAGACGYLLRHQISSATVPLALRQIQPRQRDLISAGAEQRRLEEHQRYYGLFLDANDLIYFRDRQGRVLDWNQAGERLTGYSRQEMHGRDLLDIVVPEDRERARELHERKLQGEPATRYRLAVRAKDGRRVELEINSRPMIEQGKITGVHGIARDITEQAAAENRRRLQAEQFERLFEEIPFGMAILDLEGAVLRVNPAAERLFGYRFADLQAMSIDRLTHPDDLALSQAARKRMDEGAESISLRKRYLRANGEAFWADVYAARIHDERGQPLYTLAVVQDVSESLRVTEALEESEARYRTMAENAIVGMLSVDEQGRILFANAAVEKIFGYSREELAGQSLTLLMPPDFRARFLAGFQRYLESGQRRLDWETVVTPGWHREQREIQLEISFTETRRQERREFQAVLRDVSEHHRALNSLRESKRRYSQLAETIPIGIMVSDRAHILHEVNRSFCELLGYRPEEMLGHPFYEFTRPEDIPAHIARHNDLLAGRIESYSLQKRYLAKSGQTIWTEAQGRLMRLAGGHAPSDESLYVLTTVTDITQRVRLQEKLGRAERLESVGRMAAGLAHDFSNYLTIINGAARQLQNQTRSQGERRAGGREPLEQIVSAGQRAAALTEQLLAIGRQQPPPAPETLELNGLIHQLAPTLEALLEPLKIELKIELAPAGLWIRTRATQVDQIVHNLALNARAAMPQGGRLEIATCALHSDRRLSTLTSELPAGDYVRLSVRDTGQGMDEATLAHLFEPFFTTRTLKGGTGLGLTTVYSLAEQNKAGLLVESRPGEGAEFQILWQQCAAPVQTDAPPQRQRILVVDDEEGMRWLMRSVLELAGYDVIEAGGPLEALDLQAKGGAAPALVISDVLMPEMTGPEMIQRLRPQWPGVKTMLVSAYNSNLHEPEPGEEFGEPLRKPFNPEALLERVRRILE